MAAGTLLLFLLLPVVALLIIFSCITAWKWIDARATSGDARLGGRVTQLETEVEQLKDQVAEAVIAADERQWDRLDQAGTPTVSNDA